MGSAAALRRIQGPHLTPRPGCGRRELPGLPEPRRASWGHGNSRFVEPSGKALPQLAPVASGVSHKVFSRFDVRCAGAAFQNSGGRCPQHRGGGPCIRAVSSPNPWSRSISGGRFINFCSEAPVRAALLAHRAMPCCALSAGIRAAAWHCQALCYISFESSDLIAEMT